MTCDQSVTLMGINRETFSNDAFIVFEENTLGNVLPMPLFTLSVCLLICLSNALYQYFRAIVKLALNVECFQLCEHKQRHPYSLDAILIS